MRRLCTNSKKQLCMAMRNRVSGGNTTLLSIYSANIYDHPLGPGHCSLHQLGRMSSLKGSLPFLSA